MKTKLTKAQALEIFKEELQNMPDDFKRDKIAVRESWNNFTDSLCKDSMITESQYDNWSNPF